MEIKALKGKSGEIIVSEKPDRILLRVGENVVLSDNPRLPIISATAPVSPAINQVWYDISGI